MKELPRSAVGNPRPEKWQQILYINLRWAYDHAVGYVSVFAESLRLVDLDKLKKELGAIPIGLAAIRIAAEEEAKTIAALKASNQPLPQSVVFPRGIGFDTEFVSTHGKREKVSGQLAPSLEANFEVLLNAKESCGLQDNEAGWTRASELQILFAVWERAVSDRIHNILYGTVEGRIALRKFFWGENQKAVEV